MSTFTDTMETMHASVTGLPTIIKDEKCYDTLINAWKFAGVWDTFGLVYDGMSDVPERLTGFVVVTSKDASEEYGILMQITPEQVNMSNSDNLMKQKLLAKVRLN